MRSRGFLGRRKQTQATEQKPGLGRVHVQQMLGHTQILKKEEEGEERRGGGGTSITTVKSVQIPNRLKGAIYCVCEVDTKTVHCDHELHDASVLKFFSIFAAAAVACLVLPMGGTKALNVWSIDRRYSAGEGREPGIQIKARSLM